MSGILHQWVPIRIIRRDAPSDDDAKPDDDDDAKPDDEKEERTIRAIAATQGGVDTPWGREVIDLGGMRLDRYRANPVLIDAHIRDSILRVLGRANAIEADGGDLDATFEFARTKAAEEAWTLYRDDFARGFSVGFFPEQMLEIEEGTEHTLSDGETVVNGPASVITQSELIEISAVPVGSDADALARRSFYEKGKGAMEKKNEGAPRPDVCKETPPPAAQVVNLDEHRAKAAELVRREVMAICPRGLESIADGLLLEGKTVEECRAALLDAYAKRAKPAGVHEPELDGGNKDKKDQTDAILTAENVGRALFA